MPSSPDDPLGAAGDLLWLSTKAVFLAVLATVSLLVTLGALGSLGAWVATLGAVLVLAVALRALFGDGWGPGGEARQHATFLVTLVGLNVGFWSLRGSVVGSLGPSVTASFLRLFAGLCLLALAGWLAYFGGLSRLRSLITSDG